MASVYDFEVSDAYGRTVCLDKYRGKVILIVNVALLCGFTPQYKELQYLYEKYDDLMILGFPCNQFGNQEPMTDLQIVVLTRERFNVTFPIMKKIEVNGEREAPVYKYLKQQKPGNLGFLGVKWNFEKFLIDRTGNVVARFESQRTPLQFESQIISLLGSESTQMPHI